MKLTKTKLPQPGQTWKKFPWDKFPGGVDITFVLVDGRTGAVVLSRPSRWSYEMLSVEHSPNGSLEDAFAAFKQKLKAAGVSFQSSISPQMLAGFEHQNTLRVVAMAKVYGVSGEVELVQPYTAYQIESGLALSNPVCEFVPALLGWSGSKWTLSVEVSEEKETVAA